MSMMPRKPFCTQRLQCMFLLAFFSIQFIYMSVCVICLNPNLIKTYHVSIQFCPLIFHFRICFGHILHFRHHCICICFTFMNALSMSSINISKILYLLSSLQMYFKSFLIFCYQREC